MDASTRSSRRSSLCILQNLCMRIVSFFIHSIFAFTLVSFFVCLCVFCSKHPEIFTAPELLWCIPAAALLTLTVLLARFLQRKSERFAVFLMIALETVIALVLIVSYDTQPCSDYGVIWQSANEIAQGTFSGGTTPSHYMYYFNWQLGMTVLEAFLLRLGATFSTFKVLNAALLMLIQHMEYRLVKRKFGFQTACAVYALAVLFMPWCLTIPQLTNHHVSMLFLLTSLQLLERPLPTRWLLAGFLLAVMNFLRPMGVIVLLAALCYSVYLMIALRNLRPLVPLLCLLAGYWVVLSCLDSALISAGLTDAPASRARIPYFKFQKGLYGYGTPVDDLKVFQYDYDQYNTAMRADLIAHVTTHPLETLIFVANKMVRYLGLFDYQFEMTYNHDVAFYTQYPVRALYCISWFQYIGICLWAMKGYPSYAQRHPVDIHQIYFIGNTLVYIFIEAFSSYRFESYPFLLMLAALGITAPSLRCGKKDYTHSLFRKTRQDHASQCPPCED